MIETRIDALDFLAQLNDELVFDYDATDDNITTIVTALLGYQTHGTPITVGTIQPVVTRSLSIQQDTVLGALMKLRETVGGYISVNTDRELVWMDDIGEDKGQQIRYKKNVKGLSRTREYTNFGNRLYCYGAGEGTARIHLSDSDALAVDYIEDAGAGSSQETYGMCIRQLVDKSITDPNVLYAWAVLKLAEMKDPRASYRVDMINLAAMGWDFEKLQLGSIVKVIDEDLGIDISARVVKIIRDLSDPENIQVEISNVTYDIVDTMTGVYGNQQFQDHIATQIGAGQVTVLGDFYVSDWVTGGTTAIKGAYIRTGNIESTNWAAGAGSQFNLDDGTFKLGGSAAPKLSWDGATLEIIGTLKATDIEAGQTLTVNGIIRSNDYVANVAGWTIDGVGNAEFNSIIVRGTIKNTTLDAANTLTVSGTISAGGGKVAIDTTGVIIGSVSDAVASLFFKDKDGVLVGIISASSVGLYGLYLQSEAGNNIFLNSGLDIEFGGRNLNILTKAAAPAFPSEGSIYMNTTTHKPMIYYSAGWHEWGDAT